MDSAAISCPLAGASFYASNIGNMPFVFGPEVPDIYAVWITLRPFRYSEGRAQLDQQGRRPAIPGR